MDDPNPTARALRCLELLQDHPGITADRLAARLGVSDRAARRYVAVLRVAGLPIESERGRYGGYRVGRGLRLRPLAIRTRFRIVDPPELREAADRIGRNLRAAAGSP